MDSIEERIREIVRDELAKLRIEPDQDPILLKVIEAAELYNIGRSTLYELIKESPGNGFPAVRLGSQSVLIDKRRLNRWIEDGGLSGGNKGSKLL